MLDDSVIHGGKRGDRVGPFLERDTDPEMVAAATGRDILDGDTTAGKLGNDLFKRHEGVPDLLKIGFVKLVLGDKRGYSEFITEFGIETPRRGDIVGATEAVDRELSRLGLYKGDEAFLPFGRFFEEAFQEGYFFSVLLLLP
jgi:hypothetical protein